MPICGATGGQDNCTVTQIDHYTTSFNWAQTNYAALWLRQQWYLLSNSAITDVQNGGVTFVSGGGYTASDEVPGYWALAHKDVFVGTTEPNNPYTMNAGPFNINSPLKCGLVTGGGAEPNYCINNAQGVDVPPEQLWRESTVLQHLRWTVVPGFQRLP